MGADRHDAGALAGTVVASSRPSLAASVSAIAGGFLFGIGAALNRGCAFSTLGRIGNGEVGARFTLGGFTLGVASMVAALSWSGRPQRQPLPATYDPLDPVVAALVAGLALWGAWELARLWRSRPRGVSWRALVLAESWRLSTAAALIGVANAILYALHGPWTHMRTLDRTAMWLAGTRGWPLGLEWGLFAAVLAGAILSSWHGGVFACNGVGPAPGSWTSPGGLLMGIGAALAPGANDVLVLHGIPQLSPHALPAYLSMTGGIAMVVLVMRATSGAYLEVDCRGDVCRTRRVQTAPRHRPAHGAKVATEPQRDRESRHAHANAI